MNWISQLGVALVIGVVLYSVIKKGVQKSLERQYMIWMQTGAYDRLLDSLRSWKGKWAFPKYNRLLMEMQIAQLQNEDEKANAILEELLSIKTNPMQRQDLVLRAYESYIYEGNRKQAKALLQEIKKTMDQNTIQRTEWMYDIYLSHKANHIDELVQMLPELPEHQKGACLMMIAKSYANKHDDQKAEEYEEQAKQYL